MGPLVDAHGKLRSITITGGSGYIGSQVVSLFVHDQVPVTVVGEEVQVPESLLEFVARGQVRYQCADVRSRDAWVTILEDASTVIHLAAQASHYLADKDPSGDWQANVLPVLHCASVCQETGKKPHVVLASTATVYGLPLTLPVDENAPTMPLTVYDIHKLAAEAHLGIYQRRGVLTFTALRLANVYGVSAVRPGPGRGVLRVLAERAVRGQPIEIFGSGLWLRDYVHVEDVAHAFLLAAHRRDVTGVFNVCSGTGRRFIDVVNALVAAGALKTGFRAPIVHVDKILSPIDERSFVGTCQRIQGALGWESRIPWEEGLSGVVDEAIRNLG